MTKLEILQRIVNNHNRIAQIMVSGDSAILVGETMKDMRQLVQQIQEDINAEAEAEKDMPAE